MRKTTKRNKIAYTAFATIIGLVIVGLSFIVVNAITDSNNTYEVKSGDVGFSSDYQVKSLENGTKVKKHWNGQYYYKESAGEGKVDMGDKGLIYNANRTDIVSLGSYFKINNDESIDEIKSLTSIGDLITPSVYKLDDRKYLMTGYQIVSENAPTTANFIEIIIDKGGNALLINDKVNFKTLEPTVLQSGQLQFDIANEKLIIDEREIDLKKVVGSTNVYKPTKEDNEEGEDQTAGGGAAATPSIIVGGGGAGGAGGAGGTGGSGSGSGSGSGGDNTEVDFSGYNSVGLTAIIPETTAATIAYKINDITNAYPTVFLSLKDDKSNVREITLEKSQTNQFISGLNPNAFYTVVLSYTEYVTIGGVKTLATRDKDTIRFQTKPIKVNVNITKLTSRYIYYTVKLDKDFIIESGKVKMFVSGNAATNSAGEVAPFEATINISEAKTVEGFKGRMPRPQRPIPLLPALVTLEFRDVIYNMAPITVTDKAYALI